MKRRPDEDEVGLDSLLDTLTNVVGILVIMLIVTQLSVSDSVKKISQTEQVDPKALEQAQADLEKIRKERQELEEQAASFTYDPNEIRVKRAAMERRLLAAKADLRALEQQQRQREEKERQEKAKSEALLAELEKKKKEMDEQTRKALEELAKLEALLAETPQQQALPSKVVNLPDPRPAPKGAKPVTIFCWRDRIFPADLEELRDRARGQFDRIVQTERLDRDPEKGIDAKVMLEHFGRRPLRNKFFDIELIAVGVNPHLKLTPKIPAGEPREDIIRRNSDYQKRLRELDPNKHYVRFLVWPDSFEVYLAARQVAAENKLLAGWQMISERPDYTYWIAGGKYRFGPPPKPDPNAPKPPPSNKPAAPPPPTDEID